jgi:hypothetical protein
LDGEAYAGVAGLSMDPATESEIIGVIEDVRQIALHTPGEPSFYNP